MDSLITVSQNSTPGSADFHALWIIFLHSFCAFIVFTTLGFFESIGYCCTYSFPSNAALINSSSIFTETFAPVTFPCSILASIKLSASGCLTDIVSISAPLLPSWATSLVEFEYLSINGTTPVEVSALLSTALPAGLISERSWPTPPLLFISCTCSSSILRIPPYESAGLHVPITKQLEREATWKLFPIPVIGPPCGTIYLKSFRRW